MSPIVLLKTAPVWAHTPLFQEIMALDRCRPVQGDRKLYQVGRTISCAEATSALGIPAAAAAAAAAVVRGSSGRRCNPWQTGHGTKLVGYYVALPTELDLAAGVSRSYFDVAVI